MKDGIFNFYTIQHKDKDGNWCDSNYDNIANKAYRDALAGWRRTGVRCLLDLDTARGAIAKVRREHPGHEFCLIHRFAMQQTFVVDDSEKEKKTGGEKKCRATK